MKKASLIAVLMIFFLSVSVSSALAGSKQRHQWQGAAMALGAVILGNAILNSSHYDYDPHPVSAVDRYRPDHCYNRSCPPPRQERGHWEYQKMWVPPVLERVWNPGHYNTCHQWVPGEYIMIEREPGYWKTERVWACRR